MQVVRWFGVAMDARMGSLRREDTMRHIEGLCIASVLMLGVWSCGGSGATSTDDPTTPDALGRSDTAAPAGDSVDTASEPDTTAPPSPFSAAPADPVGYSGGACPTLEAGTNVITSNGQSRTVEISLPADPTNAPVLFLFHGLGDNPKNMMSYFGAQAASANEGAIVVAPKSCCGYVE
jgi:hypothetical protein